ncbi:MAG: dihydroorotase family protein [Methanobacterium sp.]|uniref:dihydroorotase n=1 Tax=Methanobacterium sp. TaxID=2164 RepID=UPI003C723354
MLDLCLSNCKIVPGNIICNIGVDEGKIVSIKKIPISAEKIIDVSGNIIFPGLIDSHVHMRDPGLTYKEDFRTGTEAAAAGGFTTVLDMPNTKPATNTAKAYIEKLKIAESKCVVDFGFHVGADNLDQISKLASLKPASFKIFMDLYEDDFLLEMFSKISQLTKNKDYKPVISLHAEDNKIVDQCTQIKKSEGELNPIIYSEARPSQAEEVAVSKAISLANKFNIKIHICHTSVKKSLDLIINAKNEGCNITSEITPHHLFLDSEYLTKFGSFAKTNPPLRKVVDKLSLKDLHLTDLIGTDHAPHTIEEKKHNIWDAPPGIPGLETALPLLLTKVNQNKMSFVDVKRLLCENPAMIFNIPNKGFIKEGMDADFVIVDMKKEDTIKPENFYSKAHYTPFESFEVKGLPIMTIVRGNVVMIDGEIITNSGNFVYS